MKSNISVLVKVLIFQCLSVLCVAQNYGFFYFVQQWPGSYFDTKQKNCYPATGKPAADFSIRGLWPYNIDGSYPSKCNPSTPYDQSKISDVMGRMQKSWPSFSCPSNNGSSFWSREWKQHGTCSQHVLDQPQYFKSALDLKDKINLLQILKDAGIRPDGKLYSRESIEEAIRKAIVYSPGIKCSADASGKIRQLYQIYICVDPTATKVMDCPGLPTNGPCASQIKFSSF